MLGEWPRRAARWKLERAADGLGGMGDLWEKRKGADLLGLADWCVARYCFGEHGG
jgi:hypothetical protein